MRHLRLNRAVQAAAALLAPFVAGAAYAQLPPTASAGASVQANEGDFVIGRLGEHGSKFAAECSLPGR
jgi:hypothetical protein